MQPLHTLLPQLEHAAEHRIEAKEISEFGLAETRDLLYRVIANYRTELADPLQYLGRLGDQAAKSTDALTEVRDESLRDRADLLLKLIDAIRPGLVALVGPIITETFLAVGQNSTETVDPLLRGFELYDDLRKGQTGKGRWSRSGQSLWIVVLDPVESVLEQDFDPRFAIVEHLGEIAEGADSHAWNEVRLVTALEAAEKVARDDRLLAIFQNVVKRMRAASSGKQDAIAARVQSMQRKIETCLEIMEGE